MLNMDGQTNRREVPVPKTELSKLLLKNWTAPFFIYLPSHRLFSVHHHHLRRRRHRRRRLSRVFFSAFFY